MSDALAELSLTEIASLIRKKQVSSVEVTRACLERIERWQPKINCFIAVDAEDALKQAPRLDREIVKHGPRGPLHGVVVSQKDIFYRKGKVCSAGSEIRRNWVAPYSATVMERAASCRRDLSRTAEHGRVRRRSDRPQQAFRRLPQPVEPGPHYRRLVQRFRRRRRGAPGLWRPGLVHRRVDTPAGRRQWGRWPDAHLWPGQPPWRGAPGMVPGSRRSLDADGAGLCPHDTGHRGP